MKLLESFINNFGITHCRCYFFKSKIWNRDNFDWIWERFVLIRSVKSYQLQSCIALSECRLEMKHLTEISSITWHMHNFLWEILDSARIVYHWIDDCATFCTPSSIWVQPPFSFGVTLPYNNICHKNYITERNTTSNFPLDFHAALLLLKRNIVFSDLT